METVVTVESRQDLETHCRRLLEPYGVPVNELTIKPYCYDERIDWDTHMVSVAGYGVIGFTDGPLKEKESKKNAEAWR